MELRFLTLVVFLVLGLIGLNLWRRHLRESKQLRLREIIHAERMQAMEKDIPLPEADEARYLASLGAGVGEGPAEDPVGRGAIFWVRMLALCLGLSFLFGGLGVVVALLVLQPTSSDMREVANSWPLGLIPVFIGLGLLLFNVLSRGATWQAGGEYGPGEPSILASGQGTPTVTRDGGHGR